MLDPSIFLYDQKAPIALTGLSERAQDNAMIQEVSYASPLGGKVSGCLIVSPESKPGQVLSLDIGARGTGKSL